jgi:hypothetical protein
MCDVSEPQAPAAEVPSFTVAAPPPTTTVTVVEQDSEPLVQGPKFKGVNFDRHVLNSSPDHMPHLSWLPFFHGNFLFDPWE